MSFSVNKGGDFNPFLIGKIVLSVVGVYYVYKLFFKNGFLGLKKNSDEKEITEEKKQIVKTVTEQIDKDSTTISDLEAEQIASILYNAMDKIGTDEKAITNSLEGLNKDDFALVWAKFGVRRYADGGSPSPLFALIGAGHDLNLVEWFNRELSKSDYNEIKEKFESNIIKF